MKLLEYRILKDWSGFYIQKRLPGAWFWSRIKDYTQYYDGTYSSKLTCATLDQAKVRVVREVFNAIKDHKLKIEMKTRRTTVYSCAVNIETHLDKTIEELAAQFGIDPDRLTDVKSSAEQKAAADRAVAEGELPDVT